jgi:hypothetical protein
VFRVGARASQSWDRALKSARAPSRSAGHEEASRAPARTHLSLLPSGPGEVHEVSAAREAPLTLPECATASTFGILSGGGFA